MLKPSNTQSQKRFDESLAPLFSDSPDPSFLFLTSSTDIGVMRNGGRNGARFAPQSLLTFFKRLSQSDLARLQSFRTIEVSSEALEREDFTRAQELEAEKISEARKLHPKASLIHLGGGHDHVYPLLKSFSDRSQVVVINLDAHADTRTDDTAHSGTPFRQFSQSFSGDFRLLQVGLHPYANSKSTLLPLENGVCDILWRKDLRDPSKIKRIFSDLKTSLHPDAVVIFSLDADAMAGHLVPGVSAVNGEGLELSELDLLWSEYRNLTEDYVLGIYELNPLYDTLSGVSMRTIAGFLFGTIR